RCLSARPCASCAGSASAWSDAHDLRQRRNGRRPAHRRTPRAATVCMARLTGARGPQTRENDMTETHEPERTATPRHDMRLESWHTVTGIAAISFAATFAQIPADTWASTAALSLASGVSAAAMMGVAAALGSRWKWVESVFGGLDRVYLAHKWLAVWALAFASFHLVFEADADAWTTASMVTLPRPATRLVRQLSFVARMLIVLPALSRNIPYQTWRWGHKL